MLPEPVQRQAQDAYALFRKNPFHPSLHFKRLTARDPAFYSARVGRSYRALGIRDNDDIVGVWTGWHAEYDRQITRS